MPSNDDDKASAAGGPASPSTTSFNNNFFPESRPPSTITSSVHKKFNLVEAITSHQAQAYGHGTELGLIDRILSWAFEILVLVLLIVLIRKFVKHAMQERNASVGERTTAPTNACQLTSNATAKSDGKDQPQKCILVNQSSTPVDAATKAGDKRDSLRFKSKDLKYVKKRKWVSTDPIMMAHGRDLSLSPDKKWLNLRNSNTNNNITAANPMLNPLPFLLMAKDKEREQQEPPRTEQPPPDELQREEQEKEKEEPPRVVEVKLQIPVTVSIVENIYNFKNFNVC